MSGDVDPQLVREIAREHILDGGQNADDIGTYVWVRVGADLTKHEHGAWCSAIREAIRTATVSWPAELDKREIRITELEAENARMREGREACSAGDVPACCSAAELIEHDEDCETRIADEPMATITLDQLRAAGSTSLADGIEAHFAKLATPQRREGGA
jgi:hypothetical protein